MTRLASLPRELGEVVRRKDAVRVAMVGVAGGIGFCHLNEYARNPHFVLAGGWDLYPGEEKVVEGMGRVRAMGGKVYGSFEEMLGDAGVEAVDICTPHHFHREMAVAALAAGKHVLVEKPMATHPEDVAAMEAARGRSGKVGAVQMQHVGRASMLKLRERILAGAIGKLMEVRLTSLWTRTEAYYGRIGWAGKKMVEGKWCLDGALFNQCVHDVTQMLVLASPTVEVAAARVREVTCEMFKFHEAATLEVEDTALVTGVLGTPDAPRLVLIGTTCAAEERHEIELVGTEGRAVWDGVGRLFLDNGREEQFVDDGELFEGNTRVFVSFAEAVRGRGKALTEFAAMMDATRFIYDCYEACGWEIEKRAWGERKTVLEKAVGNRH